MKLLGFERFITHGVKSWKQQPKLYWTISVAWLILISWLAFLWNLGSTGLVDETEPLFAEASRQMIATGDWITPYFNGETRFDKPPLIYWLQAIAYSIFGINSLAVRLPSAISTIIITAFCFYILRYFGIPSPALIQTENNTENNQDAQNPIERTLWISAGLGITIMALNPITVSWARTGVSDMLLTVCIAGALFAFFIGYTTDKLALKSQWYLAFHGLIGLGILTKGPVAIVLPGMIIGAFLLYIGQFKTVLSEMRLVMGAIIIAAINLPWYILVSLQNGENFINSFFGHHNVERFTSVVNRHDGPWYIYFPTILIAFFPWSIYLPVAIARLRFWKRDKWRNSPRHTHLGLFALFWFAIIFVFFSIAVTKRPNYIIPLIPAAAILVSLFWSEKMAKDNQPSSGKFGEWGIISSGVVNVIFALVITGVLLYLPAIVGYVPDMPDFIPQLENSGLLIIGALIWTLMAIGGVWLLVKKRSRWLWSVNLAGFLAFLIFTAMPAFFIMDRNRQLPLRELSALAVSVKQPGEQLAMIGFTKPSVVFYTQSRVDFFSKQDEIKSYLEAFLTQKLKSSSLLIFTQPQDLNQSGLQPNQYQELGKSGGYKLIRVSRQVVASK